MEKMDSINENDFRVDHLVLEDEWIKQPLLYLRYSEKLAGLIRDRDLMREELEKTRAKLDRDIRQNPVKYGFVLDKGKKPTEGAIAAAIVLDMDYIDLGESLIETGEAVNRVSGAVKALEHKKRALEKLVELWLAGYYSEPRVRKGGDSGLDDKIQEKRSGKQKEKLNRKRRSV